MNTPQMSAVSRLLPRDVISSSRPTLMEDSKLSARVKGNSTWLVDEHPLARDWCHQIVIDKFSNELSSGCIAEICGHDASCILIMGNESGFEPAVIVCSVVNRIWISQALLKPYSLEMYSRESTAHYTCKLIELG